MKPKIYPKNAACLYVAILLLPATLLQAQICQNPTDTIYGLSGTGVIYPININNATVGASLDSLTDGNAPINSNGLGYSIANHRFYYFERSAAPSAFFQRFVYYDPTTLPSPTVLARPAPAFPNANKCRSGCVSTTGSGYYTIDPAAAAGPTLYYYSIAGNAWTTITTVFKDPSNTDISSTFVSLNSGDMAFDGQGNLWILCSSTSKYGLYKISSPVPIAAVASITAKQIIAPTTATPVAGFSITGLAFNASGAMYLSTGVGDNKLYKLATASSPLTLVGTLPLDGVAGDLTSCSMPMFVLGSSVYVDFETILRKDIELNWTSTEEPSTSGYRVEHSTDGENWKPHALLQKNDFYNGISASYHYTDRQFMTGNNFYRIVQLSTDGKETLSTVKTVNTSIDRKIYLGPNPATDQLYVNNRNNATQYLAQVFDQSGRLMFYNILTPGQAAISISGLKKGSYVLKLTSSPDESATSYQFIKL